MRRSATPVGRDAGRGLLDHGGGRRLWSVSTVLRRVERLVEAEHAAERDTPFAEAYEGGEPNA